MVYVNEFCISGGFLFFHVIYPLIATIELLLFTTGERKATIKSILSALIFPAVYFAYVIIYGYISGYWLYGILKPVLIITQNMDVIKYFEREANKTLVRNTFNAITYRDLHCVILPISHLSKKWNDTQMYHLKEEIDELFNLIDL